MDPRVKPEGDAECVVAIDTKPSSFEFRVRVTRSSIKLRIRVKWNGFHACRA